MARRKPGKAPLTRDRIIRAAAVVLEVEGHDGLSMRRVAEELGVRAMSLYAHIDGKEDLLDGVVAQAFEEFPPPPPGDWRDQLTALARGYRSWALARPAVFALLGSRPLPISEQLKLFDLTVGLLTEVGFTSDDAMKAFMVLGFVPGCSLTSGLTRRPVRIGCRSGDGEGVNHTWMLARPRSASSNKTLRPSRQSASPTLSTV